jgi:tetratricopeptide (TPR) repeat protein
MKRDIKSKYYIENVEEGVFDDEQDFPNSIPQIKNFVGREDYLKQLRGLYADGERSFVLHGTGGVGKTATTLKFAGEIAGEYRAKIFVKMQVAGENPLSATDAMFNVVQLFEPQTPADISQSQIEGLFLSFVQRQPTLIILDNAESEAQVAPLINAENACVLVSSRNDIQLTSGKTIRLPAMSSEDAEALLFKIAGKEKFEGRAGELSELAGYLPMALKPLAKLLKKEFMTIARILQDYADKKNLLKVKDAEHADLSVEASFALSYDALTDEQKRCWRSLAVFPADFESNAASAVFGLEFADGWNILEQLYDYSLIEKDAKSTADQPRFILHDLARVFADTKLSDEERFNAQFLFAKYFASILQTAEKMQWNNEENYYINALKLIDAEWSNITTGQKWTANQAEQNDEAARFCKDYSGYARGFIRLRLLPREDIDWQESSLTAARKLNNHQDEGSSLGELGSAYYNLGEYRKAIEYFEQHLEISREINNRLGEGNSLSGLGTVYNSLGEYRKAIEYHEQSLEIYREIGFRLEEGASLGNMGMAYSNLGEYRKAIEYYEQHLEISREFGYRLGEGNSLICLGSAYSDLGEYRKAIEYYEQALKIYREIGDRSGEGNSLGNLGTVYSGLGEYRKAIEYHKQHLEISREISFRLGEGNSLGNLGSVYFNLGEKEKACGLWREAVIIFEAIESPNADIFQQAIEDYCED